MSGQMTVIVNCNGCGKKFENLLNIPMEGTMRPLTYEDPSNLRNPQDANLRLSKMNFHWCDKCAGVAIAAVARANRP
jgi:hypothetical protein